LGRHLIITSTQTYHSGHNCTNSNQKLRYCYHKHIIMAPSNDELRRIAAEAEQDLNSPQAKNIGRRTGLDDAGVDSQVERKFPGAEVSYQPDLSTNAGYDRRIPPSEGGDLDARGR